jgi:GNAT superfamily N-acetyltransferase
MSRYVARKFTNKDKEAMLALFEEVWTKELADLLRNMWAWKYETNPHDPPGGNNTCVLELDGRIIGMMGLLSDLVKAKDRILPVVWAIDFAVHPDFRGGGFRLLAWAKKEYEGHLQGGIVVAGRPFEFYKKMGYLPVFSFSIFKNIMDPRSFFQKKSKNKVVVLLLTALFKSAASLLSLFRTRVQDKELSVFPVSRFDDRFDALWEEASPGYFLCMVRDKDFLNWRFFQKPDSGYAIFAAEKKEKVLGYVVLRTKEDHGTRYGTITDLFTKKDDRKTLQCLIARALEHFRSEHVDRASFAIPPKCAFYRNALIKNGFFIKGKGGRFVAYLSGNEDIQEDLMRPENWYLTPLSSDMER